MSQARKRATEKLSIYQKAWNAFKMAALAKDVKYYSQH